MFVYLGTLVMALKSNSSTMVPFQKVISSSSLPEGLGCNQKPSHSLEAPGAFHKKQCSSSAKTQNEQV